MKKVNHLHFFLLLFAGMFITACQKQSHEQVLSNQELLSVSERVAIPEMGTISSMSNRSNTDYNTFYGPTVQMGDGHVRSWINITRDGNIPLAIGIEFTDDAFQNLPDHPANPADNFFALKVHQKAMAVTPFDHIGINWELAGHPPPGIYTVPHFDMHFYKISLADQLAITGVPGPAPAAGYLPASYVIRGATVPQMGTHWLDPSSPELSPAHTPFTHTFIYGSNNGHVHFLEPMITRAFLLSGTSVDIAFPQPMHFSPNHTYYPTHYRIWMNSENNRHYVALTNFVWR
jgi:hypothetical protein